MVDDQGIKNNELSKTPAIYQSPLTWEPPNSVALFKSLFHISNFLIFSGFITFLILSHDAETPNDNALGKMY